MNENLPGQKPNAQWVLFDTSQSVSRYSFINTCQTHVYIYTKYGIKTVNKQALQNTQNKLIQNVKSWKNLH